ncbi:MAG: DUF2332 family protein [Pseudomonadota bacterium]
MTEIPSHIRQHFLDQGAICATMGSPFMERLCSALPDLLQTGVLAEAIAAWRGDPKQDALALRLCGGLKAVAQSDAAFRAVYPPNDVSDTTFADAIIAALDTHGETLVAWLTSAPQTNEVGRSAALIGGYLLLSQRYRLPLALHEIGSSAGVNLFADQYRYSLGSAGWWGAGDVECVSTWSGACPPLDQEVQVISREGSDIAPIDARDPDACARMLAYIWADQPARETRASGALAAVAASNVTIETAEADAWLEALAKKGLVPGAVTVIQHTVMWQYLPEETQSLCRAAIEALGAQANDTAPVAWLRLEMVEGDTSAAALDLTTWPGGETRRLARASFHGAWVNWA